MTSSVDFRYKRIGYVALNVTDIEATHAFATEVFGLNFTGVGPSGERLYRCGPEYQSTILYKSDSPGFVRSGWELETPEDVEKAYRHFSKLELSPQWLSEDERAPLGIKLSKAFRVHEPVNGICFEFYSGMTYFARADYNPMTKFIKFGHVGVGCADVKKSSQFLMDGMGFKASDIVGDWQICFMRPFPVADHHGFGYLPSRTGKPQFNHLAYVVNSIDDIGKLFNRIENFNVPRAFGIGRHPTSGSIHLYINDPDGMLWEYTSGMEQFPEVNYREPRFMSAAPEDMDLWYAKPKPSFAGAGSVVTKKVA